MKPPSFISHSPEHWQLSNDSTKRKDMDGKYRAYIPSACIAMVAILLAFTRSRIGFGPDSSLPEHMFYSFSHANIFHLLANLAALFQFKPRWKTCAVAYVAAVAASYLPMASLDVPTCGLSGFIFACYARKYFSFRMNPLRLVLCNMAMVLVPCVNWKIHLLSFLIAFIIYGWLQEVSVHSCD